MSTDLYKGVNFTAGQEVRAQDLKDVSTFLMSRLGDQIFQRLAFAKTGAISDQGAMGSYGEHAESDMDIFGYVLHPGQAHFRRGATPNKVQMAPGTIFQKIATSDGSTPSFLPYSFAGTEEVTLTNGHATLQRIDIVQMKLELITDDSQARVFAVEGEKASLDLAPLTANVETVIRARAAGFGGNAISIRTVADGTGVGSFTQDGYALTFHYETAVTTVANFETAIAALDLIEVETPDGVGTMTSPGDTFAATFLIDGTDQVLTSQNMNMKHRVQCTLSLKAGTAANPPVVPDPDAGYVTIAMVFIPPLYVASGTAADDFYWVLNDGGLNLSEISTTFTAAEIRPTLMDNRMPIGIKAYVVNPNAFMYDDTIWDRTNIGQDIITVAGSASGSARVHIRCPHALTGRLVAVDIHCVDDPAATYDWANDVVINMGASFSGANQFRTNIVKLAAGVVDVRTRYMLLSDDGGHNLEENVGPYGGGGQYASPGLTCTPDTNGLSVPVWTGGQRGPLIDDLGANAPALVSDSNFWLEVEFKPTFGANFAFRGPIVFWVAEGI